MEWISIATTLGEAVNAPELDWRSDGSNATPWFIQTAVSHDGFHAAQSGAIGHSQSSWIETAVTGSGMLSFWWKVSNGTEEGWDWLICATNGVEALRISGDVDWERQEFVFTGGETIIRWTYEKAPRYSDGDDCGWLGSVKWILTGTGSTPVSVPFSWLDQWQNGITDYEALAKSQGANGMAFWESYVAGCDPTNSASRFLITNFVVNAGGGVSALDWTPNRADRVYTVWGKTNLSDKGWYPTNDASRFFKVEVRLQE